MNNITQVLAAIDAELERLQQARRILSDSSGTTPSRRGRPKTSRASAVATKPKRRMSAAGRARIAAAQKARWAKLKKVKKT